MQITQVSALVLLALAPLHDAAVFMAPHARLLQQAAATATKDEEMPIMKHNKTAGDDYNEGSPLFEKQEERKKLGVGKTPPAAPEEDDKDDHSDVAVDFAHGKIGQNAYCKVMGCGGKDHLTNGFYFLLSYVIIVMLIALIWKKCDTTDRSESWPERPNDPQKKFAYGLFSTEHCWGSSRHHGPVCLCAWCCGPLRMADTYSKKPKPIIASFWVALAIIAVLHGLDSLTFGISGFVFLCFAVYARQLIRKKYDLKNGGATYVEDCLGWIFCPWCSIAQEARQVDFVHPSEYPK